MVDNIGWTATVQSMIDAAPLKRVWLPEDIANVAPFLVSDDSSFIDDRL